MDRATWEELYFHFMDEKEDLIKLQDKTVARLQFVEGVLFILNRLGKETSNGRRPTETSGNREAAEGSSEADTAEEKL